MTASTAQTVRRSLVLAGFGGLLSAGLITAAAVAHGTSVGDTFNICMALRHGASLATIETALTARGYSQYDAGAFTGAEVRDHCPEQRGAVIAQVNH